MIKITTDNDLDDSELIRTIIPKDVILTSLMFEPMNKLILAGTQTGTLTFWECDTGKLTKSISEPGYQEISSIARLGDYPYVVIGNASGLISLVALPPLPYKYIRIWEFYNKDEYELNICIHSI